MSHDGSRLTVALACAALIALAARAQADPCPETAAKIVSVQGTAEAKRAPGDEWTAIRLGDVYCPGDTLRIQANSRADVALADQTVLRLREGSTLVVQGVKGEHTYAVDLLQGAAHF